MDKGENTLEASLTRLLTRHLTAEKEFVKQTWIDSYVKFMTTPNSHNDAYAATAHRMFFKNLKEGKSLDQCPDNDHHNVDSIDALTLTVPVIAMFHTNSEVKARAWEAVKSIRNCSSKMKNYSNIWTELYVDVLKGKDLRNSLQNAATKIDKDFNLKQETENSRNDPMVAC